MISKQKEKNRRRTPGETWVWLTAMGLSMGILMVIAIIGLITFNGLEVFWPKQVSEWKIKDTENSTKKVLGQIVLKQKKRDREKDKAINEIQIFQGNRRILGESFLFFEQNQIINQTTPKSVLILDRLEYGKALVFPQAIISPDKTRIKFGTQEFTATMHRLVDESNRRWEQIKKIEKDEIGQINHKIQKIQLALKKLRKAPKPKSSQITNLEIKKQDLEKKYLGLAEQAKELRQQQMQAQLIYRLVDGSEHHLAVGQIIRFHFPNQLGFLGKISLFSENLWHFLSEAPREANTEGGVFPAIFGTLVMTILMSLAVVPFGVIAAIYLREYAKQGILVRLVRIAVNNLAGVPSIVFGVFGLGFFVYIIGGSIDSLFFSDQLPTPTFGTGGLLWASLTLALMTVPVVIVSTEEALSSVSRGVREGALACGASKWQTVRRILLPAAGPGIMTGAILAMARGAGEVAPLMLVGVVKLAPTLPVNGTFPFVHLDQKFMHLGFHIFDLGFQSPDSEAAKPMVFATTLLLISLVLILNLGAILIRERLRKKYATGNF